MSIRYPICYPARVMPRLLNAKYLILLARRKGFEPLTPRFEVWCSIQLSYRRLGSLGTNGRTRLVRPTRVFLSFFKIPPQGGTRGPFDLAQRISASLSVYFDYVRAA